MTQQHEDSLYSAYALGELEDPQRMEFEELLARSPEARAKVGELGEFCDMLETAMHSDAAQSLVDEQPEPAPSKTTVCALEPAVNTKGGDSQGPMWLQTRNMWTAAAGLVMICAALGIMSQLRSGDSKPHTPAASNGDNQALPHGPTRASSKLLNMSIQFDHDLVAPNDTDAYALVKLAATDAVAEQRTPVATAIVIDASSSMHGNKFRNARQAAHGLVDRLADNDYLTVVSFSDDAITHVRSLRLTGDRKAAHDGIDAVTLRGYTCISCGLDAAYVGLAEAPRGYARRVLVLSDGDANKGAVGPGPLGLVASKALTFNSISTATVGIGRGYNVNVLRTISAKGAGAYYFAYNSKEIPTILDREVKALSRVVAKSVELKITAPKGIALGEVKIPGASMQNGQVTISFGQLSAGDQRQVLVPVSLLRAPLGEVVEAVVSYTDLAGKKYGVGLTGALARSSDAKQIAASRHEEVIVEIARLDATRAVERSMALYRKGDTKAAVTALELASERLRKVAGETDSSIIRGELNELNLARDNVAKYGVGTNGWEMTLRVNDARNWENYNAFTAKKGYFNDANGNRGVTRAKELE